MKGTRREKVLVIGYGSIGKRHVRNLLDLGVTPYVITRHPDDVGAVFCEDIYPCKGTPIRHCIISSITGRHLDDLRNCVRFLEDTKNILIEKPLEATCKKAKEIEKLARARNLDIRVAYNLRFLRVFEKIEQFIRRNKNRIKIVEVVAGQDLREWRSSRSLESSYSAERRLGGGVDLDLSHEVDYVLSLFGANFRKTFIFRDKISSLKINSPDFFKLIIDYRKFVVDISLDYIRRPRERYLKIICDNADNLHYDFFTGELAIGKRTVLMKDDIADSYKKMLKAFLGLDKNENKLCSLKEALNILRVIDV